MGQTKIRGSKQIEWDATIDMGAQLIHTSSAPTDGGHLVNKDYADGLLAANNAGLFKGTVGVGGTYEIAAFNALATYDIGWSYRVITAGTVKGKLVEAIELNGLMITTVKRTGTGNLDTDWIYVPANMDGIVTGPASVTDGVMVLFDGATGKLIKAGALPSSKVDGNAAITAATKTKITYDAKGLVTAGADATTADIADSTDKRYCTDAQKVVITNTSGTNSGDETLSTLGTKIHAGSTISTPADTDELPISFATSSWVIRRLTWASVKSSLKTYFDTLYQTVSNALIANDYVCRDAPTGTKNGSNCDFVLANTPTSGTEMVFLNGILQDAGAGNDYTISTVTITFAVAPISTDKILVTYWK